MEKHVLIIEDETDIRDAMAEVLAEAGFKVSTATNGEQGLTLALERHPDLILLDLVMPVMDGQTMLTRLRADHWGQNVKVMIMSSMDDVDNIATAHENGLTDYLIKTHTSLEELVRQVRMNIYS